VRTDYTAGEVRRLAQRAKDAAEALRLLAIAAVLGGASREEAAKIGGMDRQTGAHAILLLDQAGWRQSPGGSEQRLTRAAAAARTRAFKSFDDIVDHCCYAWNTLIDQPWKIMSIAQRDWAAAVGHFGIS
jgi:hypothetical protein